jgi:hypothetical protein
MAAFHAHPERMLAETALLDFLREGALNEPAS